MASDTLLHTNVECSQPVEVNHILSMYKDATILITGGTGFLGKILLEKVLRCLEVRKIFLLIRRKDDLSAQERLVKLLQDAVFENVRSIYPSEVQLFAKVEAVQMNLDGDSLLCDADSAIDEQRLLQETEIIFNVLASVKFNETIRNALGTNVGGTRKVLQLAQRMTRLRSVVHVSTLYSNCNRVEIEEKIYDDLPLRQEVALQLITTLTEQEMERFQHCCLGPMPNTYTFSKKCAEVMIRDEFAELPIGIFRPPIVISTYREPLPGWTDNLNGPTGLCMWTVKGLIHTIWGDASKRANLVPVDYCVNAIIVAAYDIMMRHQDDSRQEFGISATLVEKDSRNSGDILPTYNYMYQEYSLTWGRYMAMASLGFESRIHQMVWKYTYCITAYRPLFRLMSFCLHSIPARLLDLVRRIRRKKPLFHFMQRLFQKLLWVWICLRFTRMTSKFVLGNLFAILIA